MSTYRKIHGRSIQAVTTDPTGDITEGQVWYNTTSDTFKSILGVATWVSSTPLPSTASNGGGAGIQTAALFFGGRTGGTQLNTTSEYNGSGYGSGGAMGTGRSQMGGGGTQTAALASTGVVEGPSACPTESEEYNGTAWTAGGSLSTARFALGGAGTQTANVVAGGRLGPGTWSAVTEEYDGSSWTSGGNLNQTKTLAGAMTGSLTAAVAFGGDGNPPAAALDDVTFYDGTSWTETANLPAANRNAGSAGPQTASIMFGGMAPSETANSFLFDGTTFSATGSMGSATYIMAPAANASDNKTALSMGGYGGSAYVSRTEEFTSSINVITAATFSSGGDTNVAGQARSPASGTQTASTIVGANQGPPSWYSNVTEHYNGSSWTNGGNYPTNAGYLINEGTETATIAAFNGYYPGSGSFQTPTASNEYNGSSWTAGNSYAGSARYGVGAFGTQTAALAACGSIVPADSQVQSDIYDGTNWTSGPNAVNERQRTCGTGILTAGIIGAGYAATPSPSSVNYATASNIEEYDGSSFSNSGAVLFNQAWQQGVFGTATSAIFFGGNNSPSGITAANEFNGTICITAPNMANQRTGGGGGGTTTAGLACSGSPPSSLPSGNKTEEFTGEIVTTNVKTLTQS